MKCIHKKTKLFTIFPSAVVLNAVKSILSLASAFVRLVFINAIIENNGCFMSVLGLMVLLVLTENIVDVWIEANRMNIVRKYSMKAIGVVAEKCSKLSLEQQERNETQELVKKSDKYFEKALECTTAVSNFSGLAFILFGLLFLLRKSPVYIAVVLGGLVLITFGINFFSTKATFGFWQRYMKNARRYNYFSDLQTKRECAYERRVYQTSQAMDVRFSKAFDEAAKVNRKNGLRRFWGQAGCEALIVCTSVFVLFYFAVPESGGHISLGEYAAITEMVAKLLASLSVCAESIFKTREFLGLYSEINSFLGVPERHNKCFNINEAVKGIAVADNLSFCYPGNKLDAITRFSYCFEKGRHYGVVGINGSGKTTLVKLLLGLYMPTAGNIKTTVSTTALFQDYQIYPVTVREYLLMGNKDDISDAKLHSVLSKLNCTDLRDGLDTALTLINAQGTMVSKGQLQKLAIARTFLSDAELVILDEPTASLDPISEREIFLLTRKLFHGKTVIFISHRLGAVSGMDEILVMDGGFLRERGTHEALLSLDGIYKRLYLTQKGMYIDE